ncbi:hypothetical protein GDO78_017793 [Eleutherodactylus coqui]|uniref:MPN domain-containing protein n=1 Tax=Eleutherodactylus coqui TaxID=57060 RepID=A0A8J6BL38_ELECQ|nr:hypothetical protein GDO78_017793 [Eleutherodactylus coqui]
MAVQAVHIEGDAFLVCVAHSLSTEREEVMGLCIGETARKVAKNGHNKPNVILVALTWASCSLTPLHRLSEITGRPMRVVGWYHSHPHITVWPSHVDVRTQAMYQMMDVGFVGLIFSCFIEDKNTKVSLSIWTDRREKLQSLDEILVHTVPCNPLRPPLQQLFCSFILAVIIH